MARLFLVVSVLLVFVGCRQFAPINLIDYYHIQAYKQKEGFIAVESSRGVRREEVRIVEIDTNGRLTYFPAPVGPAGGYLSTTLLLNDSTAISGFVDTANYTRSYLCLLDLRTGATRTLGKDLKPIAVSANGDYAVLVRDDSTRHMIHLYKTPDSLIHLLSLHQVIAPQPVATADNNFLASGALWRQKQGYVPLHYNLDTRSRKCDTLQPEFYMQDAYATNDTSIIYVRNPDRSSGSFNPVEKYSITSQMTTTLLDSLFINRMLPMPSDEVLIFQGATRKEYREEEEDISRQIKEFEREHPGMGRDWEGPRGYWRTFNTRTKKHSQLDKQHEYLATTRSGRYILVRKRDDRTTFSVLKTSEIIK